MRREFAELYAEYKVLYERVWEVGRMFTSLNEELERAEHDPDSTYYHSIEKRIMDEYWRLNTDEEYLRTRKRVEYLHQKLLDIKYLLYYYRP